MAKQKEAVRAKRCTHRWHPGYEHCACCSELFVGLPGEQCEKCEEAARQLRRASFLKGET
jgi:hypothetical protein